MTIRSAALLALALLPTPATAEPGIKFEVRLAADNVPDPVASGRVVVAVGRANGRPSFTNTDPPNLPMLGADADRVTADTVVTLDATCPTFPLVSLDDLPAGEYTVQAVFAFNRDVNLPHAPGNRYCDPVKVRLDPKAGTLVKLTLDKAFAERPPADSRTDK